MPTATTSGFGWGSRCQLLEGGGEGFGRIVAWHETVAGLFGYPSQDPEEGP